MSDKKEPFAATVAKSERLQTMLENPAFRAAWDEFGDQLDKATDLIKQGVQPLAHQVGAAAQRVIETAVDADDTTQ